MASCVRAADRCDIRTPAAAQNCVVTQETLSLPICHCQGPSCLSTKRRVLPSPVSYLPPAAGASVTEVVTWATLAAVAPKAGAEVLFDHRALSLCLVMQMRA